MSDMITIIKKAAVDAVENASPTKVRLGRVVSASPLKISLSPNVNIPSAMVVVTELASRRDWVAGDRVVLLQEQGGQKFVLLDRVV